MSDDNLAPIEERVETVTAYSGGGKGTFSMKLEARFIRMTPDNVGILFDAVRDWEHGRELYNAVVGVVAHTVATVWLFYDQKRFLFLKLIGTSKEKRWTMMQFENGFTMCKWTQAIFEQMKKLSV